MADSNCWLQYRLIFWKPVKKSFTASTLHSLCQDCITKFPSQHCIKDQHCAEHMFPGIPVATFVEYLFFFCFWKIFIKTSFWLSFGTSYHKMCLKIVFQIYWQNPGKRVVRLHVIWISSSTAVFLRNHIFSLK